MAKSSPEKWQQATREILDRLDIRAAYAEFGVEITGQEPSASGWLDCRSYGRVDNSPSAGINVGNEHPTRGRYKEFVGDGANLSLFDFAVLASPGRFPNWVAARNHYAEITGVKLPSTKPPRHPTDSLEFRDYNAALVNSWCFKKPGINETAVRLSGGRIATESKKHMVVTLPVFGELGVDDDPCGWVSWSITGKPLEIFAGKGIPPKFVKMKTAGGSKAGWMGQHGLSVMKTADVVWVTEGPTDLLGLLSVIVDQVPGEINRHAVICNSAGAMERAELETVAFLAGKQVYVVPDCDQPGQTGCRRRAEAIAEVAARVTLVRLPFEITENHGKDLRDYLNGGASFADLQQLAALGEHIRRPTAPISLSETPEETSTAAPPDPSTTIEHQILEAIGIEVLGEMDGGKVKIFSQFHRKTDVIPEIGKMTYHRLLQAAGPAVKRSVHESNEPIDGMYSLKEVREAISLVAGYRRVEDNELGSGCWQAKDEDGNTTHAIILVGAGEAAVRNGSPQLKKILKPRYGGQLLDISRSEPWYDYENLSQLVANMDQQASQEAVIELENLFSRWRWSHQGQAPKVLSGLVIASWIQTVWDLRPMVTVNGQSNSGKSVFFQALSLLFGNLALTSEDATGAGIAQVMGNRASIMLLDEFDTNRHRKEILKDLRRSSRGGQRFRGTPGKQAGISWKLKHIVWTAGIESGLIDEADKNRFIRLELVKPPPKEMGKLHVPPADELNHLGQRVLAIAIKFAFAAKELAAALGVLKFPGTHERLVQCYAVPAACYALAMGEDEVGPASEVLGRMLATIGQDENLDDGRQLIADILETEILLEKGERASVAQILERRDMDPTKLNTLEAKGVAVVTHKGITDGFLFVSHRTARRYLLRGTDWEGKNIDEILCRLPDCEKVKKRCAGRYVHGIAIPFSLINAD